MKDREEILFPVGRLVMGSLYTARTTNMKGELLRTKIGPNAGQPRIEFFFAVAIAKTGEQSWAHTEWGKKIYGVAIRAFPNGEFQLPTFSWKIVDGDSQIPNGKHVKPCDRQGYPGNWVLSFTGGFAPILVKAPTGLPLDMPKDSINPGDFVQVIGNVRGNETGLASTAGVYLNHSHVAFVGHGVRIFLGTDPTTVPWSKDLPPGAASMPVMPTTPSPLFPAPAAAPIPVQPAPMPTPYPAILQPQAAMPSPPPVRIPQRQMTAVAQGYSYEALIAAKWTDEALIQGGLMVMV